MGLLRTVTELVAERGTDLAVVAGTGTGTVVETRMGPGSGTETGAETGLPGIATGADMLPGTERAPGVKTPLGGGALAVATGGWPDQAQVPADDSG